MRQPIARALHNPLLIALIAIGCVALFVLAPLRVALALAGLAAALLLALIGPIWGVLLAILSVPIQQVVVLPGGTSITQAAVVLMTVAWLIGLLLQPRQEVVTGPLFWCWLGLLGALMLSTSLTPYSLNESLKATSRWIVAFLVWFVAVNTVRRRWQLWALIAALVVAPTVEAAIGLTQFAIGDGPESFRIIASLPFVRAYGTIGQPNSFAGYMNMAWPLAWALAIALVVRWRQRRAIGMSISARMAVVIAGMWLAAGMLLLALGVSFSLGGWIGALCGCIGLSVGLGRRWALGALIAAIALVLFLALGGVQLLPAAIAGRLTRLTGMFGFFDPSTISVTPENFALVERMAQMKAGALMFLTHPFTGVGPGAYSLAYGDVAAAPWYASRGHAHNFYLHMAAETGLIGLLAYLALIGAALVLALRGLRQTRSHVHRGAIVGCCGIIAAVAGHNLFENLHVLNLGLQLSGIWALLTVIPRISAREASAS